MQCVGGVGVKVGDDLVVGFCNDFFCFNLVGFFFFLLNVVVEVYFIVGVVVFKFLWVIVFQLVVRRFFLLVIDNILFKYFVVVVDVVIVFWQIQCCQGVKEVSCQVVQIVVVKFGVIFFIDQFFEIEFYFCQCVVYIVINVQ